MRPRAWGPLCASLLLIAAPALADFTVPKKTDYVTDTAGVLTADDLKDLNNRLGDYERQSGNQIFVLVTKSLEGEPIEDVSYKAWNTWGVGKKGKDNGVLLVIALDDRRIRIETGKGVGGDLTDLQSNYIIRQRIAPLMRENNVHDAILAGIDGITEALSGAATAARQPPRQPDWEAAPVTLPRWFDLCFWGFIGFVVLMLLLRSSRHPRRRTYWGGPFIGGGWGGGGGGGGGGFGGGGGDGGSGFSGGGGGETGGGGSSDSF